MWEAVKDFFVKFVTDIDVWMLAVEIAGIALVLVTLRRNRKTKQAEFIMDYNFHFISSKPLVEMERKLENCYQIYQEKAKDYRKLSEKNQRRLLRRVLFSMRKAIGFGPVSKTVESVTRDYQKLINYLVYLESFAPLVLRGEVDLKEIDDTFGYRYFIAMNNPFVQKYELLPEADYYCGCIQLYEKWLCYRRQHEKRIPMEWFSLSNTGENDLTMNPVYQTKNGANLLNAYKRIAKKS